MTSVTFQGRVYSDDGSTARDMRGGGHRQYLLPMLGDAMLDLSAGVAGATLAQENAEVARDQAQAAAVQTAADKDATGTDRTAVAADKGTVQASRDAVAADKAVVTGLRDQAQAAAVQTAADKDATAADRVATTGDRTAVATARAAVAADRDAVAADKTAVIGLRDQAQAAATAAAGSVATVTSAQVQVATDRGATATALAQAQALVGQAGTGTATGLAYAALTRSLGAATDVIAVGLYDRRQDGDGGAWGDRANRSWCGEALGTATRGVTRRFPVLCAWVLRASGLTLYDMHDLDAGGVPRMWMAFPAASSPWWSAPGSSRAACMSHGRLWICTSDGAGGGRLHEINFALDAISRRSASALGPVRGGIIAARASAWATVPLAGGLAASDCLDVHAYAYPGAPLDSAGLPVPTVAVATTGGVSVIHPSGAVYDITGVAPTRVRLLPDGRLIYGRADGIAELGPLPFADVTAAAWRTHMLGPGNGTRDTYLASPASPITALTAVGDLLAVGQGAGLCLVGRDPANPAASMTAMMTMDGATGWMPGGVLGAYLGGTAAGSISGGTVLDNDLSSATGWTLLNVTHNAGAGTLDWAGAASAAADYTATGLVAGQTYLIEVQISAATAGGLYLEVPIFTGIANRSSPGLLLASFTAAGSSQSFRLAAGFSFAGSVTAVRIRRATPDRSVRTRGLSVNGTLNRTVLPCGLAAWSDFGAANFLEQPHNSDLDLGTGDFCVAAWLTHGASGTYKNAVRWADGAFGAGSWTLGWWTDNRLAVGAAGASWVLGTDPGTGSWTQAVMVRRAGVLELWQDGVLVGGTPWTTSTSLSGAALRIGSKMGGDEVLDGAITLVRIAAYAPTPAQIRRMWEDERALIIGGQPATLGGTVNNVTALTGNEGAGTLAVGTGDGVSLFAGLGRAAYYDGTSTGGVMATDAVASVAAAGPHLLIATSGAQGGTSLISDAVIARDRLAPAGPPGPGLSQDRQVVAARGVTTDATPVDLAPRIYIGEREAVTLDVTVQARTYGATSPQGGTYRRLARYIRDAGGNVSLAGTVQTIGTDQETTSGMDVALQIDTAAQTVTPRVTGVAATRIVWTARITVTRISEDLTYAQ